MAGRLTYTSLGYAQQVTGPGSQVYWTANARDAELRLTQQTTGNGVVTTQSFDALTDREGADPNMAEVGRFFEFEAMGGL